MKLIQLLKEMSSNIERQFLVLDEEKVFITPMTKIDTNRSKTHSILVQNLSKGLNKRIKPHELELIIPNKDNIYVLPMDEIESDSIQISKMDDPHGDERFNLNNKGKLQNCIVLMGETAFIIIIDKGKDDEETIDNIYIQLTQDLPNKHVDIDSIEMIYSKPGKILCYQMVMSGNLMNELQIKDPNDLNLIDSNDLPRGWRRIDFNHKIYNDGWKGYILGYWIIDDGNDDENSINVILMKTLNKEYKIIVYSTNYKKLEDRQTFDDLDDAVSEVKGIIDDISKDYGDIMNNDNLDEIKNNFIKEGINIDYNGNLNLDDDGEPFKFGKFDPNIPQWYWEFPNGHTSPLSDELEPIIQMALNNPDPKKYINAILRYDTKFLDAAED